jgi:hypothetical protein
MKIIYYLVIIFLLLIIINNITELFIINVDIKRNAYVLTTNKNSERTIFSKNILEKIGFNVILIQHIPNENKVLSNKLSMQKIYEIIINDKDNYAYVFEDDINILEEITLSQIIKYETISDKFFYLGCCLYNYYDSIKINSKKIDSHDVYIISGNVRGLHAIGISKQGAAELLQFSKETDEIYMDCILENFSKIYPANILRYDLSVPYTEHRGLFFQDRNKFPSEI